MRVMQHFLIPAMQDGEKPQVGPETARIGGDGEERLAHGTKQKVIDQFRVLQRDRRELVR
jgi:hypothetical protein